MHRVSISLSVIALWVALSLASRPASAQIREEWIVTYAGPAHAGAGAGAIALDPGGNPCITGTADRTGAGGGGDDFCTLQYRPDGSLRWVAFYDGPVGGSDASADIAVDARGHVYVTGSSAGPVGAPHELDWATVEYDADGNELWVARYDGDRHQDDEPSALAVDPGGNVVVVGRVSSSTGDFATVKYDPDGNILWSRVEPKKVGTSSKGGASDVAVDALGNIYVVGAVPSGSTKRQTVIKYGPDGTKLWQHLFVDGGPGRLALDGRANVHAVGRSGSDVLTVVYDTSGTLLWSATHDAGGNEWGSFLALDGVGRVVVSGSSQSPLPTDYLTLCYDRSGALLWEARYDGALGLDDECKGLALDSEGNVHVTGVSGGGATFQDFATIGLDPRGTLRWEVRYDGGRTSHDYPVGLVVDDQRGVYVLGTSLSKDPVDSISLVKYERTQNPAVYCTARPSSLPGCTPTIDGPGPAASVSSGAGSYDVTCGPVPGGLSAGLAIYTTGGPAIPPLGSGFGLVCITPTPRPLRLGASLPGGIVGQCNGTYSFDLGAFLVTQTKDPALVPGATMDLQVWYRDPANPGTANLSNAMSVLLEP